MGMPGHGKHLQNIEILRNVKFASKHVMTWFQPYLTGVKNAPKTKSCTLKIVKLQLESERFLRLVGVRENSVYQSSTKPFTNTRRDCTL